MSSDTAILAQPKTFAALTVGASAARAISGIGFQCHTGILIQSTKTNTGVVYIGDSSVTTANGIALQAGENVFIAVEDPTMVYLVASAAGQDVRIFCL